MKFTPTTVDDLPQLADWAASDPEHREHNDPSWWLTGTGWLAFCFEDKHGPVFYCKVEQEGDLYRLHCQFAPTDRVSKRRLAVAMLKVLPVLNSRIAKAGGKGVVFNSISPELIQFYAKLGFKSAEQNDYVLSFEEQYVRT